MGPFWSVTNYKLIKAVDSDAAQFSSEPTIGLNEVTPEESASSFISMDEPQHSVQRKAVAPVAGPRNLAALEPHIRERVVDILDNLPVRETFNWVDRVSIELTTQMPGHALRFPFRGSLQAHALVGHCDLPHVKRACGTHWKSVSAS